MASDLSDSVYARYPGRDSMQRRERGDYPHGKSDDLWFDPDLAPVLCCMDTTHESVEGVLVLEFLHYAAFTRALEEGPVAEGIRTLLVGFPDVPHGLQLDLQTIQREETIHGEVAADLLELVERRVGFGLPNFGEHQFMKELQKILSEVEAELRPIIKVLAVALAETLITEKLRMMHTTPQSLQPVVRNFSKEHAADETFHRTIFNRVLKWFCPQIPPQLHDKIAPLLPRLLLAYLAPDREAYRAILDCVPQGALQGGQERMLERISLTDEPLVGRTIQLEELDPSVRQSIKVSGGYALDSLRAAGLLDVPQVREEFAKFGFVEKEKTT